MIYNKMSYCFVMFILLLAIKINEMKHALEKMSTILLCAMVVSYFAMCNRSF